MKTTLAIEGMHCAGCAGSIERALGRLDGVTEVRMDREAHRAEIEHDASLSSEALVDVVKDIGFAARCVKP